MNDDSDLYGARPGQVVAGEEVEDDDDDDMFGTGPVVQAGSGGYLGSAQLPVAGPLPPVFSTSNPAPQAASAVKAAAGEAPEGASDDDGDPVLAGSLAHHIGSMDDEVLELDATAINHTTTGAPQTPPLHIPIDDSVEPPSESDTESYTAAQGGATPGGRSSISLTPSAVKAGLSNFIGQTRSALRDLNTPTSTGATTVWTPASRVPPGVYAPKWSEQASLADRTEEFTQLVVNQHLRPLNHAKKEIAATNHSIKRSIGNVQDVSQHIRVLNENLATLNTLLHEILDSLLPTLPDRP